MGAIDGIKEYLWTVGIKKAVTSGIKFLVAAYGAKLAGEAANIGVTLSFNETALIASAVSCLELLRNWIKQKTGLKII